MTEAEAFESYLMLSNIVEDLSSDYLANKDRQITVTRMNISFNDKDCKLVTFTDITIFKSFQLQREKSQLLATLNASIHHE